MKYRNLLGVVSLVTLGAAGVACSSDSGGSDTAQTEDVGSLGLKLQAANGSTLASFSYTITGPAGFSKQATIPLTGSDKLGTLVGGIPVGVGYSVAISSAAADGSLSCSGSAPFDVAARAVTAVTVKLACKEAPKNGSAAITGNLNSCPVIDGISATPQSVQVGNAIALSGQAHDSDAGPAAIAYHWSAATGTFSNADAREPGFTCTANGDVVVTLTATDSLCTDTLTATVNCTGGVVGTPKVVVNEVESNGGVPGDWVELYNAGTATADISGYKFKDNDDSHAFYIVPAGTLLAPGAYYMLEEAQFGFGLGAADSARVWDAAGVAVDTYSWTAHAASTYGRCPNGTGAFVSTTTTKAAANDCGSSGGTGGAGGTGGSGGSAGANGGSAGANGGTGGTGGTSAGTGGTGGTSAGTGGTSAGTGGTGGGAGTGGVATLAWPGTDTVTTVDVASYFGTNMSGLHYEPATATAPAVLWAAQNSPSKIFRLLYNGTNWVPDTANGWSSGKLLHYTNGSGAPDSEGLTKADYADSAMYVATERDNNNNQVSRLSILRFDTNGAGELTATNDWNVTADIPTVGPNLGLEAITFVPDAALVANGFLDEVTHVAYNPANYANHGGGLFFVGVEGNGVVYAYALDHVANTFVRVATFASGQVSIMDLAYDRENNYLWGYCDNTCGNKATIFRFGATGAFQINRVYNAPASLPASNNEGITFAPNAECTAGQRSFFWSDDDSISTHALRRGSIPCGSLF